MSNDSQIIRTDEDSIIEICTRIVTLRLAQIAAKIDDLVITIEGDTYKDLQHTLEGYKIEIFLNRIVDALNAGEKSFTLNRGEMSDIIDFCEDPRSQMWSNPLKDTIRRIASQTVSSDTGISPIFSSTTFNVKKPSVELVFCSVITKKHFLDNYSAQ